MDFAANACLDDDQVVAFLGARLGPDEVARVDLHLDTCPVCRLVMAEAAAALRDSGGSLAASSPALTFAPDQLVADRYRVVRFIARGGMGEVYEVEDQTLRERVALKTLLAAISDEWRAMERLKREVQLARRIGHPNVYRVFDLGSHVRASSQGEEQIYFITMELLPGETLGHRLRSRGRLTPQEALPLLEQMMSALSAAHQCGVVHRDFKTDNVMLLPRSDGSTRVVVTDFGLARALQSTDRPRLTAGSGAVVGSAGYMAPEQLEGTSAAEAADIYALGVVLFEMLTGSLPFAPGSPRAPAARRADEPAPSLRTIEPALGAGWERLILRCLERVPERRWASVSEMAAAVDRLVEPRPATGRRTALALAAAVATAAAALWIWRRAGRLPKKSFPGVRLGVPGIVSSDRGGARHEPDANRTPIQAAADARPDHDPGGRRSRLPGPAT